MVHCPREKRKMVSPFLSEDPAGKDELDGDRGEKGQKTGFLRRGGWANLALLIGGE